MNSNEYERFQRLMQFAKNHRPTGGFSNLYVIRKSVNGVPTGEAYGMNVMTDFGFSEFFQSKKTFPTNLYIGDGSDESFNFKTNKTLIRPVSTTAATLVGSALSNYNYYKYPMWYDSVSGLISLMCKYIVAYFPDQSSGGITTDVNVTEYGIGADVNNLWTHSWLYDLQGDRITNFTKYPNERLDIEVFFVLTYNESLITDGFASGRYFAMTTMQLFLRRHMGYDTDPDASSADNIGYTYRRNNTKVRRNTTRTIEIGTNSNATIYTNCSAFELYNTTGDEQGYIDGFIQMYNGYICIEPQVSALNALEPINNKLLKARWEKSIHSRGMQYDNASSDNNKSGGSDITESSVADAFGYKDETDYAFTNMNLTALNLYNFNTGRYDNPSSFTNDSTHQYTETALQSTCGIAIYYTNTTTGNIIECWLHINPVTSDPIIRFEGGNTGVYATDKYWDRGSWTFISDPANIPNALRTKRFYITTSNSSSLIPIRESQEFKMKAENNMNRREINLGDTQCSGQYSTCENYEYGYFVKDVNVYIPDKTRKYTITGLSSGRTYNTHFCFKNMIVSVDYIYGSGTAKYYWTNLSDLLDPQGTGTITTNQYSFYDANNGFSSGVTKILEGTYKTETTSGVIGFQSLETNEFVFMYIEFETDNIQAGIVGHLARRFKRTSRMGCCIIDSTRNRVAYYDGTNIIVEEYTIATNTWSQIASFELPSGSSEPTLMFGLRDYLWVTNGSSYMILYDLANEQSGTGTGCAERISLVTSRSDAYRIEMTAVDEVILLYKYTDTTIRNGYYIEYAYPQYVKQIPYSVTEYETYTGGKLFMKLKKIRSNTLALVMAHCSSNSSYTGSFRAIADFGKYIKPPVDTSSGIDISSDYANYDIKGYGGRDGIYCYGNNYVICEYGASNALIGTRVTNIIPIEFAMTHAYTGTTSTITTINHIRHLSDKQWSIEVTNIKDTHYGDSGKPPGSLG